MKKIEVTVEIIEHCGIPRFNDLISLGIPFKKGFTRDADLLFAKNKLGNTIPAQFKALSKWPDGSIKWVLAQTAINLDAWEMELITISMGDNTANESVFSVISDTNSIEINTGNCTFNLYRDTLRWRSDVATSEVEFADSLGRLGIPRVESPWNISESGSITLRACTTGSWIDSQGNTQAKFECSLLFKRNSSVVTVDLRIHNCRRAIHKGGLWDLGDPASLYFEKLVVVTRPISGGNLSLQAEPSKSWHHVEGNDSVQIYQNSSGGENWNNRNHSRNDGQSSVQFRGYQVRSRVHPFSEGMRASPLLEWRNGEDAIRIGMKQFWQQFPSALAADSTKLCIELFPATSDSEHELQAGERKHHTCYIDYKADDYSLSWINSPLQPTLSALHYQECDVFPWFCADASLTRLESLIQRGIDGPSNFFHKREVIDEYGWRNFGDLFADHETHNQPAGEPPLISHYNNQYDPIYGFARQFALSGDGRWFELMDDLARHVVDIDIYHTTEDRSEYNNGLFWHTDHYLDAHTATHRTYTRHNSTSSVAGQTGGGPAAEHCYTTGLLYHYWMTGNDTSRQAVLELAGWITANQEGVGGALEQILALKKNELPQLKAMLKGQTPSPHRYPFTRGTGNYLNALLDAWQLSLEPRWLKQAESVIAATLHPADDIELRELLNVELRWSYLVLLSAIVKYLQTKIEAGQIDDAYHYARDALVHYTRWMVANERPFLSVPEQLEFPNHTWAAQDIRKAMLMFQASRIDPEWSDRYLAKGQEWLEYVTTTLQGSPEGHYTRILVLLMLNHGPHHAWPQQTVFPVPDSPRSYSAPHLTWATLTQRVAKRIIKSVINFRPARERAWLKTRMN